MASRSKSTPVTLYSPTHTGNPQFTHTLPSCTRRPKWPFERSKSAKLCLITLLVRVILEQGVLCVCVVCECFFCVRLGLRGICDELFLTCCNLCYETHVREEKTQNKDIVRVQHVHHFMSVLHLIGCYLICAYVVWNLLVL